MNERTIFFEALEKADATERAAYLTQACGSDAAMRQRVESLLQSHEKAGSFLIHPPLSPDASVATPGDASDTQTSTPTDATYGAVLDFLAPAEKPESLGLLDHYDVLEVVGRGGMGIVLRAFDEKLHRVVALKVMTREISGSAAARKRFSREAKAAAAVVHDHIVPIHAIEESGPTPYLVMQFIEGHSLQHKIDAEGSLELKEILRIGMQIASGLAAAHRQGLVHRDIKPSNILLENGVQRVKITDFGLARAVDDSSVSQSGIVAGTPQYMSPEQADGQPVDHRSDLFSLGSVLYAMCTGRPPFRAASTVATLKRVCDDTPRPIRELNPDMPEWICDIVEKLHAKKPAERFQSAREVSDLLEQHLAGTQLAQTYAPLDSAKPIGARGPMAQKRRWPRAVGWTVLIVLILVCIAVWGNAVAKIKQFFYHELIVKLPDTDTVVQFWETSDTEPHGTRITFSGAWPLEPRATIANTREKKLRLPPANYWLFATRGGKRIDERLLKIGWGGHEELVVNERASSHADQSNEAELQRLVALQEQAVKIATERTQAGIESAAALTAAEIELVSARVDLAEAQRRREDVHRLLNELVQKREEQWEQSKKLLAAGRIVQAEVDQAEKRVIEARLRQSKAAQTGHSVQDSGWVVLFNGNDLEGWTVFPADRKSWKVIDGVLVGHGRLCHLFSERGDFENFHLRMEMRVSTDGAVGEHIRAPLEDPGVLLSPFGDGDLYTIKNRKAYGDDSPPNPPPPAYRTKTLCVFGRGGNRDFAAQAIPGGEWVTHEIIADGQYVRFRFNNVRGNLSATNDKVTDRTATRGHIAWQLFDEDTTVEIRRIEIKELPKKVSAGSAAIDGRWIAESAEYQGRKIPDAEAKTMFPTEMMIKATQYGITWDGKQLEGTLSIDALKSPAEMDFSGSVLAGLKPRKVIFKLEGNHLTLCLPVVGPNADPPRPTEFTTGPQSTNAVLIYRRAE